MLVDATIETGRVGVRVESCLSGIEVVKIDNGYNVFYVGIVKGE